MRADDDPLVIGPNSTPAFLEGHEQAVDTEHRGQRIRGARVGRPPEAKEQLTGVLGDR